MQGTFGTISHGTMRPEDLIPDFVHELRRLDTDGEFAELISEADGIEDFDTCEDCDDILSELFDALDSFAPAYAYFGAHPGDGSDYGYWLCEDWQQLARDDGVVFADQLPDDITSNEERAPMVCVVSDHGNATLYEKQENGAYREVWSVV